MAALICLAPLFSTNTAQAAGGDVVSVADYGAAADSGEDSAPAIIKAVDKAKELAAEGKNVTIAFPKGALRHLSRQGRAAHPVRIEHRRHELVLQGQEDRHPA